MSDTNSICERCGFIGEPVKKTPGSTGAQVTLFILGIITFGIVLIVWAAYVIWRIVKTEMVCPSCGSAKTMVALSSPLGEKLRMQFASVGPEGANPPAPPPLAGPAASKQCPYCAETIKAEARLCRYCGKDLEPTVAPEPARAVGQRGAASPVLVAVLCVVAVALVFVVVLVGRAASVASEEAEAKVHQAKVDLHTLDNCIDLYKVDFGRYPTTDEGLRAVIAAGKCKPGFKDPWGHEYVYVFPGKVHPESFDLMSYGADGQPGGEGLNADIVNE